MIGRAVNNGQGVFLLRTEWFWEGLTWIDGFMCAMKLTRWSNMMILDPYELNCRTGEDRCSCSKFKMVLVNQTLNTCPFRRINLGASRMRPLKDFASDRVQAQRLSYCVLETLIASNQPRFSITTTSTVLSSPHLHPSCGSTHCTRNHGCSGFLQVVVHKISKNRFKGHGRGCDNNCWRDHSSRHFEAKSQWRRI